MEKGPPLKNKNARTGTKVRDSFRYAIAQLGQELPGNYSPFQKGINALRPLQVSIWSKCPNPCFSFRDELPKLIQEFPDDEIAFEKALRKLCLIYVKLVYNGGIKTGIDVQLKNIIHK